MRFEDIIGHETIKNELLANLQNCQINHALLFSGIGGIGKKFMAQTLARAILCQGQGEKPCGQCSSCLEFSSNNNPDYLFVTSQNKTLKKEEIGGIIDFLSIRPFNSSYKLVVVEHFEQATPEAQNSILKTLEEAPSYARLILLSENNERILETVMSRLKEYRFHPIDKKTMTDYLTFKYGIKEEEAAFYANFSGGSLGQAIRYIEDMTFRQERVRALEIFDNALKGQKKYVIESLDFFKDLDDLDLILDIYLTWLRDLLLFKLGGASGYIYNSQLVDMMNSEKYLDMETINKIKIMLIDLKKNIRKNISQDFSLELFFIDVMEECNWKK